MEGKTPPAQVAKCQDHLGHKYRRHVEVIWCAIMQVALIVHVGCHYVNNNTCSLHRVNCVALSHSSPCPRLWM